MSILVLWNESTMAYGVQYFDELTDIEQKNSLLPWLGAPAQHTRNSPLWLSACPSLVLKAEKYEYPPQSYNHLTMALQLL